MVDPKEPQAARSKRHRAKRGREQAAPSPAEDQALDDMVKQSIALHGA